MTAKVPQCHPSLRTTKLPADLPDILLGARQTMITDGDQAVTCHDQG